jgi:hypothetical protein
MMSKRLAHSALAATLVSFSILLAACGGGSTSDSGRNSGDGSVQYVAAKSGSYSPILAKDANNQSTPVYWKYRMNQGQPISGSSHGTNVSVLVSDFTLAINPVASKRTVHMQGAVSGDAVGTFSADSEESIDISGSTTKIKDLKLTSRITVTGADILFSTASRMTPYAEWFIDKADLDTLALNYTTNINVSALTDVSFKLNGTAVSDLKDIPGTSNEAWTVIEKLPSMTIGSKTFSNVIKLTRATMIPDVSTGSSMPITMTYWVAKGIGMIKGIGQYPVLNRTDLVIELVETNLATPF